MTARHVHEHGGHALDIPDSARLSWTMSDVAMHLVLRGDEEDRECLQQVGDALVANHAELRESQSELLARRWATELDINQYRAEQHDNGIAISVSYDPSVTDQLDSAAGQQAVEALRASGLMMKALDLRDGRADLAEAAQLWRDTAAIAENPTASTFDIYPAPDILSAAAAAVVLAAHSGKDIQDKELSSAARLLLDAAHDIDQSAPPELAAETLSEPLKDGAVITGRPVRETVLDMGADRSIASVLPILLRDEMLRTRTSLMPDTVASGIRAVATSPFFETRERLMTVMQSVWELPCETHGYAHAAALAAARRLIVTAGYGPVSTQG